MPPFGLKAFARRKSGGTSLDVTGENISPTAPTTGFRVIPRDEAHRKSIGTLDAPNIPYQAARQSSYDEDYSSSNRGSNSSAATSAKSRIFDPPTTRFSSSSTLHSPAEPVLKKAQSSPNYLSFPDDLDSEFGDDIFSGLNSNRRSRIDPTPNIRQPPAALRMHSEADLPKRDSQQSPFWNRRSSTDKLMSSPRLSESPVEDDPPPPPPHKDTPKGLKGFPYLRVNDNSSDELTPPPARELRNQPSFNRSPDASEDADARMVRESVRSVRGGPNNRNSGYEGSPLGRATNNTEKSLFPPKTKVVSHSSSDNSLKTSSIGSSASSTPLNEPPSFLGHSREITPVSHNTQGSSSNSTTPRATRILPVEEEGESIKFDPSVVNAIRSAETRNMLGLASQSQSGSQLGVMTAAQFAALKEQEKRNTNHSNGKAPVENESDDDYEDDSDDEQVQAERRKIQAHKEAQHALWRQKMKKDIGDHSGPTRPDFTRTNMSAPNLSFPQSNAGSSEEDDDVPLAILQAHNFPSNTRPPDPRNSANSFISPSSQMSRPGSAGGRPANKQRQSNLPIFAPRVQPQDLPYVGADLVRPSNREAPQFNASRAMSSYGGGPRGPPPRAANLPPNGLIGIIVDEERGKAARRGSPNGPNGMGYLPPAGPSLMNPMGQMGPQMPMGGYSVSPMDSQFQQQQAQIAALQQQIALQQQLYELQSQNMQLGMGGSLMGSNQSIMGVAPMMSNQSIMGQPFMAGANNYGNRPMSIATNGGVGSRPPLHQGRTMSMASQSGFMNQPNGRAMSMASFSMHGMKQFAPQYAPSVAPSERSNIGQPSRYKPVSFPDGGSTITAGSTAAQTAIVDPIAKKKSGGFLSAMMHSGGKKTPVNSGQDDEDEEDWGKMLRKRKNTRTEK